MAGFYTLWPAMLSSELSLSSLDVFIIASYSKAYSIYVDLSIAPSTLENLL